MRGSLNPRALSSKFNFMNNVKMGIKQSNVKRSMTLAFALVFFSLSNTPAFAEKSQTGENQMNLTEALQKLEQESKAKIPEAGQTVMSKALVDLTHSGIEKSVKKVGEKLPDFTLPNAEGKNVSLEELKKQGPVVIAFYRGGWCPYCNLNLHYLQKHLKDIRENGGKLVAISPETPDNSLSTKEKNELKFDVLSDTNNEYARKLGLVFKLPEDLQQLYLKFGIDLTKSNGNENNELPLSATFIVDEEGTVTYRFVDVDYKKRMDPQQIVRKLSELKSSKEKACSTSN